MLHNGDVVLNETFWRCLQYSLGDRGVKRLLQYSPLGKDFDGEGPGCQRNRGREPTPKKEEYKG